MDTPQESISVYLRSDQAEIDLSTTHKLFFLSELIGVNPDTNILVGVTDFECPYTFYTIRAGINDQITLGFNSALYPDGEYRTTFIPEGNYEIDDFLPMLNGLRCFTDPNIVLTFDNRTNKLTLTRSGAYNKFAFTVATTCSYELGIPKSDLINIGLADPLNYTSPQILPNTINLGGTSCLYIRVNNLGISNLNSKGDSDGTIAKIDADILPNEFIYYRPAEYFFYRATKEQIREIDIELLDDQQRPINLNGGIFSLTLTLKFAYKKRQRFIRGYFIKDPQEGGNPPLEPPVEQRGSSRFAPPIAGDTPQTPAVP